MKFYMVRKCISILKRYCKNYWQIENYDEAVNDQENIWDLHHKDEIDLKITRKELIANELYYDCKPERLIFLPHNEHARLHGKGNTNFRGKHHSKEAKEKIGKANKGKTSWNKGLTNCYSHETLKKMSEVQRIIGLSKAKTVQQIDLQGNIIKEYVSAKEVCRLYGYNYGNFKNACRKGLKMKGYIWKYKDK